MLYPIPPKILCNLKNIHIGQYASGSIIHIWTVYADKNRSCHHLCLDSGDANYLLSFFLFDNRHTEETEGKTYTSLVCQYNWNCTGLYYWDIFSFVHFNTIFIILQHYYTSLLVLEIFFRCFQQQQKIRMGEFSVLCWTFEGVIVI